MPNLTNQWVTVQGVTSPLNPAGTMALVSGMLVKYRDWVYFMGGADTLVGYGDIYRIRCRSDGTLEGPFAKVGILPEPTGMYQAGHASKGNRVYVGGGFRGDNASFQSFWVGEFMEDGTIGNWQNYPVPTTNTNAYHGVVVGSNGYVYFGAQSLTTGVYYAKIMSDGSLGTWQFQDGVFVNNGLQAYASMFDYRGYLIVIGGGVTAGPTTTRDITARKLMPDGSVGPILTLGAMSVGRYKGHGYIVGDYLWMVGGNDTNNAVVNTTSEAVKLETDGNQFGTSQPASNLPGLGCRSGDIIEINGQLFVMGWTDGTNFHSDILQLSLKY